MLVIVHHRNVHFFFEAALNFETFGRFNIFKVHAAEGRLEGFYNLYKLIYIFGIQLQVEHIDIGEDLKQ
ncbi:hypothetical protein D9M68_967690 [compost metagenome]